MLLPFIPLEQYTNGNRIGAFYAIWLKEVNGS